MLVNSIFDGGCSDTAKRIFANKKQMIIVYVYEWKVESETSQRPRAKQNSQKIPN